MKNATKFLLCMNLLLLTIFAFQMLTVKLKEMKAEGRVVFTQSKNVETEPSREDEETKKVALTFDDGPDPDYTEELLDGLKERNVKATFFLLGKQAEQYPEMVKRIHEEGHLIGNHSYSHVNLATLSATDAENQIRKTNEVLFKITGEYPEYLRPPFGNKPQNVQCADDMVIVLWDVDPLDWCCESSAKVTQKVVKNTKENDIILLHDASASSVKAALEIVDELQRQGYEFVTVDELIFE